MADGYLIKADVTPSKLLELIDMALSDQPLDEIKIEPEQSEQTSQ